MLQGDIGHPVQAGTPLDVVCMLVCALLRSPIDAPELAGTSRCSPPSESTFCHFSFPLFGELFQVPQGWPLISASFGQLK